MELRVILVGPENPLNVGFVARAMRCFEVTELTLVTDWTAMPDEARVTGVAAPEVLSGARLVPTLAAALEGCATAVAFSRRPLNLEQREFDLPSVPAELATGQGRVALVFGRESNGLTREEAGLCPWLCRIPSTPGISLNLGQAAALALYQLRAGSLRRSPTGVPADPVVAVDRLMTLYDFLEARLGRSHRFKVDRLMHVRQMLYRLDMTEPEFNLLFSVVRELDDPMEERRARKRGEGDAEPKA